MRVQIEEVILHIINDCRILGGEDVGPADGSWQDVAGTLSTNLQVLASLLEKARKGKFNGHTTTMVVHQIAMMPEIMAEMERKFYQR